MLRTISTARIVMPTSIIRMAAGRTSYTESEQAMCFMAGANAIFTGDRMLTTPTNGWDEDTALLNKWGLTGMQRSSEHFKKETATSSDFAFAGLSDPNDVLNEQDGTPQKSEEQQQKEIEKHEKRLEDEMMESNEDHTIKEEKEAQPQLWS
jgi:hypothetical protein